MPRRLSFTQRLYATLLGVVAVGGWALALTSMANNGGLKEQLNAAEAELSTTQDRLESISLEFKSVNASLRKLTSTAGDYDQLSSELRSSKAELATVRRQITDAQQSLDDLKTQAATQTTLIAGDAPRYLTTTRARVRAAPTTNSAAVAIVPEGQTIEVLEIVEDGKWYKVGGVGYMFHELLVPSPPDGQ